MIPIMLAGTFSGGRARESRTDAVSSFNFEDPGRPRESQGFPGTHKTSQGIPGLAGPPAHLLVGLGKQKANSIRGRGLVIPPGSQ